MPITCELDEEAFTAYTQVFKNATRQDCFENGKLKLSIWREIANNDEAYNHFFKWFKNKNNDPNVHPRESHKIITFFYSEGRFMQLLCLNWDTLIERAYRICSNGNDIPTTIIDSDINLDNDHRLWKLYGCVLHPEIGKLILPCVSAYLPDKLKTRISDYNANAVDYKIITIGYSGKSEDPNNSIESQVKSVVGHRLVVSIRPDLNLGAPKVNNNWNCNTCSKTH